MSKQVWGPITWTFLHTMAEKLIESEFNSQRVEVLNIINQVCGCIPCPECRAHALNNIKSSKIELVRNKQQLIDYLYEFHNRVNQQTHKSIQQRNVLDRYKYYKLSEIINAFCRTYSSNSGISKLMADNFARAQLIKYLINYFKSNGKSYVP